MLHVSRHDSLSDELIFQSAIQASSSMVRMRGYYLKANGVMRTIDISSVRLINDNWSFGSRLKGLLVHVFWLLLEFQAGTQARARTREME